MYYVLPITEEFLISVHMTSTLPVANSHPSITLYCGPLYGYLFTQQSLYYLLAVSASKLVSTCQIVC